MNKKLNNLDKIAEVYQAGDYDFLSLKYGFRIARKYYCGDIFLELGCSIGESTIHILNSAQIIDVVDASKKVIEMTSLKINPLIKEKNVKVTFHQKLWEDFIYKPNYYSDIIWFRGLEHIEYPDALIDKLKKSLKKSGRLHIIVPNAKSLHRKTGVYMGLLPSLYDLNERDIMLGHYKVYDRKQLIDLMKLHELKIINSEGVIIKPLPNTMMMELFHKNPKLIEGYFKLGKEYPDLCGEIYICATPA